MTQTIEQMNEQLQWFFVAYSKKHKIKLSFAKRTIEQSLHCSFTPEEVCSFLIANQYAFVEKDIAVDQAKVMAMIPKQPSRKPCPEKTFSANEEPRLPFKALPADALSDDIDDVLNQPLKPNESATKSIATQPSHLLNDYMLREYDKTKDENLIHSIVAANLKLVPKTALRFTNYMNHSLSDDDLIQEGIFALYDAVKHYDYTRGFTFGTYATSWIIQRVIRAIINTGSTVRVPVHMVERIRKIKKNENRFIKDEKISINDLCRELEITEEQYREAKLAEHRYLAFTSLNQWVGADDTETELGEYIPNDYLEIFVTMPREFRDPSEIVEENFWKEELINVMDIHLTQREQNILRFRYGFEDGRRRTLEEVGRMFGLTRERIRQIESKALARLRRNKQLKRWHSIS